MTRTARSLSTLSGFEKRFSAPLVYICMERIPLEATLCSNLLSIVIYFYGGKNVKSVFTFPVFSFSIDENHSGQCDFIDSGYCLLTATLLR